MKHTLFVRLTMLITLLALTLSLTPLHAQTAITTDTLTVTLGDAWQSQGALTYPTGASGRLPTVVLLNNLGTDMDFSVPPQVGGPAAIYKDLAESLSARGIAVFRFNMRYVSGPDQADQAKIAKLTMTDHASDAEQILAFALAHPLVDPQRVFVYGWSASSPVAAAVAAQHPDLAGLILQGPVASTERQIFIEDYERVVLPYILRYATNGQITAASLTQARDGNGGWFAKNVMVDFTDASSTDTVKVNPFFDANHDGVLDLNAEVLPKLGALVDSDPSRFVAFLRGLPDIYTQAPNIHMPVLILQGENDPAARLINTRGLDTAFSRNSDYALKVYPGVGHSLSPSASLVDDRLNLLSDAPKADFAAWVLAHGAAVAAPATLPRTGGELSVMWLVLVALGLVGLGVTARRARV